MFLSFNALLPLLLSSSSSNFFFYSFKSSFSNIWTFGNCVTKFVERAVGSLHLGSGSRNANR